MGVKRGPAEGLHQSLGRLCFGTYPESTIATLTLPVLVQSSQGSVTMESAVTKWICLSLHVQGSTCRRGQSH